LTFQVPADVATHQWEIVCDSFDPGRTGNAAANLEVGPRSIVVLRSPAATTAG
jgi:glycogen operon protein